MNLPRISPNRIRVGTALLVFACGVSPARSAPGPESLCAPAETIVFSCHVGKKLASLCTRSGEPKELIYRFGVPGKLELVYPSANRKGAFTTSTVPLAGGGVTTVAFTREGYEYRVYSKISRGGGATPEERMPEFEDGIEVYSNGKSLKRLVCDDGGEGFRQSVDWLPGGSR